MKARLGIVGLGTMGSNLALNASDHGFSVALLDLDDELVRSFAAAHPDRELVPTADMAGLMRALERPRRVLLMVPAGKAVDATLETLAPLMEPGDIVIDGGNSHFDETERRGTALEERGIRFVGMGVSGGAEGARHGPSLMPGGPLEAYAELRPILEAIAARSDAGPCVAHLGTGGAGHFVKMVHNGIEYADMQAIAEAYQALKAGPGWDADRLAATFAEWNEGPLESFLVEITADIFRVHDETDGPLVETILDEAGQKGTGRWTAIEALRAGVPAPSIAAAVDARVLSSMRTLRVRASQALAGPASAPATADPEGFASDARDALLASRIAAFAQGFDLIRRVSDERGWGIPLDEVARVWRAGCIIRNRLLDPMREALGTDAGRENLLLDPDLGDTIESLQPGWRRAIAAARELGVPVPCWSAALDYFDAFRTARLPQNLTQAQRDYFGAHRFRTLSDPGGDPIHADWTERPLDAP